jgi:hypothetical protein
MTPLANYLTKRQLLPAWRRKRFHDPDNCLKEMFDIHCFDCTAVAETAYELGNRAARNSYNKPISEQGMTIEEVVESFSNIDKAIETLGFLPASNSWFEYIENGERWAVLVKHPTIRGEIDYDGTDNLVADVFLFQRDAARFLGLWMLHTNLTFLFANTPNKKDQQELLGTSTLFAMGCCLLINSPQIIGRTQHMPNQALERKLTQKFGVGKFPLHAWTEIHLKVNKPIEIDDGESHEAHLTGRRALHFVRKHIRIRLGRLEYVSAHWRGDPSIGIKQSRYKVTV